MLDDAAIAAALDRPDLARLLDDLVAALQRYVVMSDVQARALALWITHTYVPDAAESTPYIWISGPTKRTGKTRTLEVLALYVRTPIEAANVSEAALFRVIERQPTILFDEIDAVFGPKAEYESLRGLLNAGHRRGGRALRCVGEGSKQIVQEFPVFCPKAFAGIGANLPDTLIDRSIAIRLKRKTRNEQVARLRARDGRVEAEPLRTRLQAWSEDSVDVLADARPDLPVELDDRQQDCWESLLAIADLAGRDWAAIARRAAVELSTGADREQDSDGIRLLADIRGVFDDRNVDRLATAALISTLTDDEESPWRDWKEKGWIKPRALADLLAEFGVRSRQLWIAGTNVRGFEREQFEDAWKRYAPPGNQF